MERSKLSTLLDALDKFANQEHEFDSDSALTVLRQLDQLRFYLLKTDVIRANTAKERLFQRITAGDGSSTADPALKHLLSSIRDFDVSPEMSDEYYLTEE